MKKILFLLAITALITACQEEAQTQKASPFAEDTERPKEGSDTGIEVEIPEFITE